MWCPSTKHNCPAALFLEATPALIPPLFTLPVPARVRIRMGQKITDRKLTLGQCFIGVDQIALFNDLLRHQVYTSGCRLKCRYRKRTKWSVCKENNSTNEHNTGDNLGVGKSTGASRDLGKQQSMEPSAHFQAGAAIYKFTVTQTTNFPREIIFWANGNEAFHKTWPLGCVLKME